MIKDPETAERVLFFPSIAIAFVSSSSPGSNAGYCGGPRGSLKGAPSRVCLSWALAPGG
jgi:hypothetical protein